MPEAPQEWPPAGRRFWLYEEKVIADGVIVKVLGGTAVGWRATQWAMANEGTTLEMTPVGRGLSLLGRSAPSKWWSAASSSFAQGANGTVVVFQGTVLRLQPVLNTFAASEYPYLLKHGNQIVYMGVGW